uniref:Uncharacterized protein n=1 Tax=Tanacetum cinerariifolium TaxID=118510 RepID=A0A6L2KCE3_TANCI|nr:hypothetical protein [Tanacetum cinerariifolium]
MAPLTFADMHNMVAFMSKSNASKGFDQIVDLMLILFKGVLRRDLHLDDADGVKCLPNEEIFVDLARMGYEKPLPKLRISLVVPWHLLSSALLQFLHVVMDNQVDDMTSHNTKYTSPALTQKKVAELEQDKHTQALEILKLNKRVKKLEKKKRLKFLGFKRLRKVAASQIMNYDKVRPIFNRDTRRFKTLFKPDKDVEQPKKKRVADETLLQESFKKLKAVEVSDWEIHTERSRTYWKIIRVGGITEAYQSFEDMLNGFDREELVAL